MGTTTAGLIHLEPDEYYEITSEDFNAPGLRSYESVGPARRIRANGPLVMLHDGRFDAGKGIGHHPHQGMERIFYILEGAVDHNDVLNGIEGHMATGDLGILTEGRRGMIHSEWNHTDGPARAYILVYPNEPLAASASFDAIRGHEASTVEEAPGVRTTLLVGRGSGRLNGDVREFGDSRLQAEAELDVALEKDEGLVLFVVEGRVEVQSGTDRAAGGRDHTFLVPPRSGSGGVRVRAAEGSRVLRAIHGPG